MFMLVCVHKFSFSSVPCTFFTSDMKSSSEYRDAVFKARATVITSHLGSLRLRLGNGLHAYTSSFHLNTLGSYKKASAILLSSLSILRGSAKACSAETADIAGRTLSVRARRKILVGTGHLIRWSPERSLIANVWIVII